MIYDPKIWLKNYDKEVPPELDIQADCMMEYIEKRCQGYLHRPAFNFLGVQKSYKELFDGAYQFAKGLSEKGFGKGDVVAIHMPNIPHYLFAMLGALKAGCTITGISPLLSPDEAEHELNDCKAKVLVTLDVMFEQKIIKKKNELPHLNLILTANVGDYLPSFKRFLGKLLKKIPVGKVEPIEGKEITPFVDFCKNFPPEPPSVQVGRDEMAIIQYTGGTTGPSKGAVLSHGNMLAGMSIFEKWVTSRDGEGRNLALFPYFHIGGLAICWGTLMRAGEQTLIPNPRDLKFLMKEWKSLKPTWGVMAPSLFILLLGEKEFHEMDFAEMEWCYSGSAPFSPEVLHEVEDIIGKGKITECYGMTETCAMNTANPQRGMNKVGSVGLPYPSTHVRIVDIETGLKDMPLGEEGEIIISGPQVTKGYFNRPEETKNALRDHDGKTYLHTGDVGHMDEDGYIWIVDRVKDMLIVGGYKVFSAEVESKFYDNHEIKFCALIGIPNPEKAGSEIVKLYVQKNPEFSHISNEDLEAKLISFAKEKMAPYKVPKIIEFIDEMPLTGVGKVDKKVLRARN